ncbi:hypothetical protein N0V83_001257 [Neocucurbitaria cava]|uniref:PNPLA domain-containing protein n=1 Tax=Neocucurbitaria cava TaxID=798079 RepID=A0A9W8YF89_9PLEO|nr:hypothetical protein N0V83_001257 [Neocucurbitaria cava]
MLGRLRYTVKDAIDHYLSLAETVFTSTSSDTDAAFDHRVLEKHIQKVIVEAPDHPDAHTDFVDPDLIDWSSPGSPRGCRTFVVASPTRGSGDNAALLRSYGTPLDSPSPGRIWEIGRATSAAPTFFSPIVIDMIKYGDGGLMANNPTRLAIQEANELWPGRSIGCLLSLGTGEDAPNQLIEQEHLPKEGWTDWIFTSLAPKPRFKLEVAKWCVHNTTRCNKVHYDVLANLDRDRLRSAYFRLNTPDIGKIGLEEWQRMPDMINLTNDYMAPRHMKEEKSTIAKQIIRLMTISQPRGSEPRNETQSELHTYANLLAPPPPIATIEYTQTQGGDEPTVDSSAGTYPPDTDTAAH